MAVLAPIPSARVSTAIAVKAGCFASIRKAYRKSWRTACMELLATQGHNRIDATGAARRDPASKESGAEKHRSDLKVNPRVNAANFEKETLQKMRDGDRAGQANG